MLDASAPTIVFVAATQTQQRPNVNCRKRRTRSASAEFGWRHRSGAHRHPPTPPAVGVCLGTGALSCCSARTQQCPPANAVMAPGGASSADFGRRVAKTLPGLNVARGCCFHKRTQRSSVEFSTISRFDDFWATSACNRRSMSHPFQALRTRDLYADGFTQHAIRRAVAAGQLLRVRRGLYVRYDCPDGCREAASLGGRLDCLSALQAFGVFVLENTVLHIQITPGTSRIPHSPTAVRHWRSTDAEPRDVIVSPVEALRQAIACLEDPYAIVASVDSALHLGVVGADDLSTVFAGQPRRKRRLRLRVDRRAEAGSESILRMLLEELGCETTVQVRFHGIGRVDLIVDGWLAIECDSRGFHSSPEQQAKDRRRDRLLAALGYFPLRFMAEDIFYRRDAVRAALIGVLSGHRPRRHPLRQPRVLSQA